MPLLTPPKYLAVAGFFFVVGTGVAQPTAEIELLDVFPGVDEIVGFPDVSLPPDPYVASALRESEEVAVGQVVNRSIRFTDTSGAVLNIDGQEQFASFAQFFGLPGDPFIFDPRLVFDPWSKRFILSTIGAGHLRIAWSKSSNDPKFPKLGDWQFVETQWNNFGQECNNHTPTFGFVDQPSLGYDNRSWLVSGYLGVDEATNPDTYAVFYVKQSLTLDPPIIYFSTDFPIADCIDPADPPGTEAPCAAEHFDPPLQYVSSQEEQVNTPYFLSVRRWDTSGGCGALHDTIRIWSIADPLEPETVSFHIFDLAAPECFDAALEYDLMPVSGLEFRAGDARVTNVVYRQQGQRELLYAAHAVKKLNEFKIVIRWYKIQVTRWPGLSSFTPKILDWGEIEAHSGGGEPPIHLFMPAIGVNDAGDMCIVMHDVSENDVIGLCAWGRTASGVETPITSIEQGENASFSTLDNRWGDYTGICVDPDGETFWITGEYMLNGATPQDDFWATIVRRVRVKLNQ